MSVLVSALVRHMFDVENFLTFTKSLFIENRGPLHGGGRWILSNETEENRKRRSDSKFVGNQSEAE